MIIQLNMYQSLHIIQRQIYVYVQQYIFDPFPHTSNLQQTTKTFKQKYGKSLQVKEQLLNRGKNNVSEGEIAHHEPFLLLIQCYLWEWGG